MLIIIIAHQTRNAHKLSKSYMFRSDYDVFADGAGCIFN